MPMGVKNGPATYQRVIDTVLGGLKWSICIVYLDDILIFSPTIEKHLKDIECILERLSIAGLTLKPSKCNFCMTGVEFLGYFINSEGIHMLEDKIVAIRDYPDPKNLHDARQLKGMMSFYERFIPKFSSLAKPITNLFRKGTPFVWEGEPKEAFERLKKMLMSYPVLCHYDPKYDIELHCDASGYGLGAVIGHVLEDKLFHPIEYASRGLSKAEMNYSTTDKECLAVVWAIGKFRIYLSKPFRVYTDHQALAWIGTKESLPRRLQMYEMELSNYTMEIIYRPGKANCDADALSRNPVLPPEDTDGRLMIVSHAMFNDPEDEDFRQRFIAEQKKDSFFGPIYEQIITGRLRSRYAIVNDLLYRTGTRKAGDKMLVCVPRCMQEDVMYALHDDVFACHLGVVKCLDHLRRRFFFPEMEPFVRSYIRSCRSCLTRKKECKRPYGYLRPIPAV